MSDFETAARPYARALFELASEDKKLQQWQENLQQAALISADPDMLAMFEQPAIGVTFEVNSAVSKLADCIS